MTELNLYILTIYIYIYIYIYFFDDCKNPCPILKSVSLLNCIRNSAIILYIVLICNIVLIFQLYNIHSINIIQQNII